MMDAFLNRENGKSLLISGVVIISNSLLSQFLFGKDSFTFSYVFGSISAILGYFLFITNEKEDHVYGDKKVTFFNRADSYFEEPLVEKRAYSIFDFTPRASFTEVKKYFDVEVQKIIKPLILDIACYQKILDLMNTGFNLGLSKDTNDIASIKMIPSFVRNIPSGKEQGNFLALDLGGTNFRVLKVTIDGRNIDMVNEIFSISEYLMKGPGENLFDYIANCLSTFITKQGLDHQKLPLGFTFSFPVKQYSLTSGSLMKWTKGFSCSGVEGEDVVALLLKAVKKKANVGEMSPIALLNDTVGTLMSCAHSELDCYVGVILGTGSNACYMENLNCVDTWSGDREDPCQVIINTEWGAFGDNGELDFIKTKFDKEIDATSINPGKQIYEKMISGMYMGELVRLVLVDLHNAGLIFQYCEAESLFLSGSFFSKYVSEVESDTTDDFPQTRQIIDELNIFPVCQEDCSLLHYVCCLVSTRAASLSAAGISAILNRMRKSPVTVGIDGSLYRYHPKFHTLMSEKIAKLSPNIDFKLVLSNDGSGKGAALTAAVAQM